MYHLFRPLLRWYRHHRLSYTPLVEITIYKDALLHNLEVYKKASNLAVAPVLKSNAYGHGLVQVARVLEAKKPPFFVVDSYHEALILRNEGIQTPILVIGFCAVENILKNRLKNVAFTITSIEQLRLLTETPHTIDIHIKIDTGMHRQGLLPEDLAEVARLINESSARLHIVGVCSHLADGDNDDPTLTNKQINLWNELVKKSESLFPSLVWKHLSASSGLFYHSKIDANVMRLGLGLYGIYTNPTRDATLPLKPALEMCSVVSSIKKIKKGETVGYGGTFTAPSNMTIATIPAGYFEGINRALSNRGSVKILNHFCPIIGRVSMNITTVDISGLSKSAVTIGTPVTIISPISDDPNSIQNISATSELIPYELSVYIPQQLKRVVR